MRGRQETERTCDLCGSLGECFDLRMADRPEGAEPLAGFGCVNCLRDGRFEYFHTTEAGYLFADGLRCLGPPDDEEHQEVVLMSSEGIPTEVRQATRHSEPPSIPLDSIRELRRTPDFPTWNEVDWPVHCDDFMVYLGTWEPADFVKHSPSGTGRDLFQSMVHRDHHELWSGGHLEHPGWGITCYAFRCTKCRKLRGIVDYT